MLGGLRKKLGAVGFLRLLGNTLFLENLAVFITAMEFATLQGVNGRIFTEEIGGSLYGLDERAPRPGITGGEPAQAPDLVAESLGCEDVVFANVHEAVHVALVGKLGDGAIVGFYCRQLAAQEAVVDFDGMYVRGGLGIHDVVRIQGSG